MAAGIWFQIWGAAEEKARSPKSVFTLGTWRRDWLEERSEVCRVCSDSLVHRAWCSGQTVDVQRHQQLVHYVSCCSASLVSVYCNEVDDNTAVWPRRQAVVAVACTQHWLQLQHLTTSHQSNRAWSSSVVRDGHWSMKTHAHTHTSDVELWADGQWQVTREQLWQDIPSKTPNRDLKQCTVKYILAATVYKDQTWAQISETSHTRSKSIEYDDGNVNGAVTMDVEHSHDSHY